MKSKLFIPITLCSATMLIGSVFAQYSDCLPCQRDQPASPGKACCGSNEYNPETHECCGGKIVENGKCCRKGGTPTEYDKNSQCCENAGVLPKEKISNLNDCPNRTANGNPPQAQMVVARQSPLQKYFFKHHLPMLAMSTIYVIPHAEHKKPYAIQISTRQWIIIANQHIRLF